MLNKFDQFTCCRSRKSGNPYPPMFGGTVAGANPGSGVLGSPLSRGRHSEKASIAFRVTRSFWWKIAGRTKSTRPIMGTILVAALLQATTARAADEPLVIAKQGNFYIGGKYVESNGDRPMVGQMYVQYQIPARQTHPYPIVMVHGGSQTGSGWISTPDGREGWATYFLRQGYAVYV